MTDEEKKLIITAEASNEEEANKAMEILREKYDKTYGWCLDCDYLVVKESECCMNKSNMTLKEITRKVVSYCDIPQDITEKYLSETICDSYIEYELSDDPEFDKTELDVWLSEAYPKLMNTKFLIHIDY